MSRIINHLLRNGLKDRLDRTWLSEVPGLSTIYTMIESTTVPNSPVWIEYEGYDLYLDPSRKPADKFYRRGVDAHERNVYLAMKNQLSSGDTAVDAGACIGTDTLLMRRLVGEPGRVISIEPNPYHTEFLRETIEQNEFSNVKLLETAVSNTVGSDTFYDYEHAGKSGLLNRGDSSTAQEFTTSVSTIPKLLNEDDIDSIDFLKMDIEGAELQAVAGLGDYLTNIECMVLELHCQPDHHLTSDEAGELIAILNEYGTTSLLTHSGHAGEQIQSEIELPNRTHILWHGTPMTP